MIFYLKEDTNKALTNHFPWHLPDGVKQHLLKIKDKNKKNDLTKNHTTKEAWDHLNFVLDNDNSKGLDLQNMKRIKHWFDTHQHAKTTKQYELYGGDVMMNWVNNQLTSARLLIKQQKEADRLMGKFNSFRKPHDEDKQTKVTKTLGKIATYNPITLNKQNKLKELTALN